MYVYIYIYTHIYIASIVIMCVSLNCELALYHYPKYDDDVCSRPFLSREQKRC